MKKWQRSLLVYVGVIPVALAAVLVAKALGDSATVLYGTAVVFMVIYFLTFGVWAVEGEWLWRLKRKDEA